MNSSYYETLDENFTQALKLYEQEYTHSELIELLNCGNIVQKQIAALRLDGIYSNNDAQVLVSNLTGQDGKIREAVSLRLNEFMSDSDICRNVISAISNLKADSEFCNIFCQKLTVLTFDLLEKIEKFDFQDGKYKVNKEVFKLYWCLETIYEFYDKLNFEDLKQIILRAKEIDEYTIREKAARILTYKFEDEELADAKIELQNDKNYYVRRFK